MSYFARTETVGTGVSLTLAVPFKYLRKANVHVYVDDVEVLPFTLLWPTVGTIQLPGVASYYGGKALRVQRITPSSMPEVTFTSGGLDAADLNRIALQLLYLAQEYADEVAANKASLAAEVARLDARIDAVAIGAVFPNFAFLPSTEPDGVGHLWNNGGVLCISGLPGLPADANGLPTENPGPNAYWNNGGFVAIGY